MTYRQIKAALDCYNWDDGFALPEKLLNEPECDLALALEIFYLADGYAFLVQLQPSPQADEQWLRFIRKTYGDILSWRYEKTDNKFAIPITRVQKHCLRKAGIPDIFLDDIV